MNINEIVPFYFMICKCYSKDGERKGKIKNFFVKGDKSESGGNGSGHIWKSN